MRLSIVNSEKPKTVSNIFSDRLHLDILEKRNEAFRLLYNTVMEVEGADDNDIFQILCRNLSLMANAEWTALASFNAYSKTLTLESIVINKEKDASFIEQRPRIVRKINNDAIFKFKEKTISKCHEHRDCLIKIFSDSSLKQLLNQDDKVCYRLSCIRGGELVAVGLLHLGNGERLQLKDMVDTFLGFSGVIIQRVNSVKALQHSEERFRSVVETANDAVIVADENFKIVSWNFTAKSMFGYKVKEAINMSLKKIIPKTCFHDYLKSYTVNDKVFSGRTIENIGVKKDGTHFPIELSLTEWNTHENYFYTFIIRDITLRKQTELQIVNSLEEKEVLLKEIHHRVKNNLQIISSLLYLQSKNKDPYTACLLQDSQTRIKSIALIHEMLYKSEDLANINFCKYIQCLVENIFHSYSDIAKRVKKNVNIKPINLRIETAIPCGLIINELVSNSLKYAFPDDRYGTINIEFNKINDTQTSNKYRLVIADDGVGFPENFNLDEINSLGLQLVKNLTDQIDGALLVENKNGIRHQIEFKFEG